MPWGLTAVNQLGSPSKTRESSEEAAPPCRAPAHGCDFFRRGRCQRQSSGLQDTSSEVSFWCQSTGKALVTVQIWSPSERLLNQLVLMPNSIGLSIFVTSSKSGWLPAWASYMGLGDDFLPTFKDSFCLARRLSQHPTSCDQILVPQQWHRVSEQPPNTSVTSQSDRAALMTFQTSELLRALSGPPYNMH